MLDSKKADRLYKKSIQVLKKVQLKNGGCLASPPGQRYPYVYPRDHVVCILGFLSAGMHKEAKKGLNFVLKAQLENGSFPQRYDKRGKDASYKPIQLDGSGLTLYALAKYYRETNDSKFILKNIEKIRKAIRYIKRNLIENKNLVYTPNSIHEFPPIEKGLEVWTNAVCCAGLEQIIHVLNELEENTRSYNDLPDTLKLGISEHMWNERIQSFIKTIRLNESSSVLTDVDMSPYALADFQVIPDEDKRIKLTVKRIEKELWNKDLGGICRYPKHIGRNNGGWGPWPHFTLMLCRHFIRTGNKKKADKYLNWVLDISYKDMLPEHVSTVKEFEEYVSDYESAGILREDRKIMIENARKHPMFKKKKIAYSVTPLAWPHAEFIITYNLYKETFNSGQKTRKKLKVTVSK